MMLYCFLVGLVFAGSYCKTVAAQQPEHSISLDELNDRITVLEEELEHGGRQNQALSLNSKLTTCMVRSFLLSSLKLSIRSA